MTDLHELLRRESRCLLQYVREVPVWTARGDDAAAARVKDLALAEQHATDAVGRYLGRMKVGLSHLGAYPAAFTTLNDVALGFVLTKLLAESERLSKQLDADISGVEDAELRGLLGKLASAKVTTREALAGMHPAKYVFNAV